MPTRRPTESGHFQASDGTRLYFEYDQVTEPLAALLIVHGFGDHCGRYADMAARFVERGYSCYRFDYRGHGRADGRRGHIFDFEDYQRDLAAFRAHVAERVGPETPQFLLSHSNGGLISLHGVARDPKGLAGLVFSSPFFGLALKVPVVKATAGRWLSKLIPAMALPTGIDAKTVSHDPDVIAGYDADPLVGHVASARWFTETVAAQANLGELAKRITLPVLHQQAGDDRIASAPAAKAVFEQLASADRTLTVYDGLFHEIWFELEREPVLDELEGWLARHLPSSP